eukprot:SAG31_NODE_1755_length_7344_cov_7.207039_8_plen_125_part_00
MGVDVDSRCTNSETPLLRCPLAVFFNLSAAGAAPAAWRVNSNLALEEIVPGEFVNLPALPWAVEVMRRGSYFFLKVNGSRCISYLHRAATTTSDLESISTLPLCINLILLHCSLILLCSNFASF